jgi:hypothetical protein
MNRLVASGGTRRDWKGREADHPNKTMSKKVLDEIVAGVEMAVARAKGAKRRGRAKRHALLRANGYSRAEVLALGKAFPTRGELCHHCGLRIPIFAELSNATQRRIRALIREDRPIMAVQELRAFTGCSLPWAKLWVQHAGRPRRCVPVRPAHSATCRSKTRARSRVDSVVTTGRVTAGGIRTGSASPSIRRPAVIPRAPIRPHTA